MGKGKQLHSQEFKDRAVALAEEIGAAKAAEKLGLANGGVIGGWKRWSKTRSNEDTTLSGRIEKPSYSDLEKEVFELRKQLREEKKVTEILKDATAFFSQIRLK